MPMPQLTQDQIDNTRDEIVRAGLDIYRREGLEAVTMRSIAARLSTSSMHAYRYFRNKDDLICAMQAACFGELENAINRAVSEEMDPQGKLVALAVSYIAHARRRVTDYELMFMVKNASGNDSGDLKKIRSRIFGTSVSLVAEHLDRIGSSEDARTLLHLSWAGFHGLMMLEIGGHLDQGRSLSELVGPLLRSSLGIQVPVRSHASPGAGRSDLSPGPVGQERRLNRAARLNSGDQGDPGKDRRKP